MKKGLHKFFSSKKDQADALMSRYRYFRSLLNHNHRALNLIADMEQLYYSGKPFTLNQIRISYEELLECVTGLVYCLEAMTGTDYPELISKIDQIDERLFTKFSPSCTVPSRVFVVDLADIEPTMKRLVGSKALNLSILTKELGLRVPEGFVITSYAFQYFLDYNNLNRFIENALSSLVLDDYNSIDEVSKNIHSKIINAQMPKDLMVSIETAFMSLKNKTKDDLKVAVRSSAVGEDTEATFAGQYESVLNVGLEGLYEAYKEVIASKYSPRAINYRLQYGIDDKDTPMAVLVLEMVRAKSSGVLYTVDPAIRPHCPLKVTAVAGLGEQLVSGSSSPDIFILDRLENKVLESSIADKDSKMVALKEGGVALVSVRDEERVKASLDEKTLLKLREVGLLIEEYFESPQDIEWAVDERDNLILLQSRLLNVPKIHPEDIVEHTVEVSQKPLVSGGETASSGIAVGKVVHYNGEKSGLSISEDSILVAKNAIPELAKYIGSIKGIITEVGSSSSHLASVAREFGVPALFGVKNAMKILMEGQYVTLWANKARVYDGLVEEIIKDMSPSKKMIYNSSVHRRMREVLDLISPLTLTDATSEEFLPEKAQTFHDIIRYTHEIAVREMFGIGAQGYESSSKARLIKTKLPLNVWLIDLTQKIDTSKKELEPQDITSIPFNALWRGFSHPGVNWEGTMSLKTSKISSLFAVSATSELGEQPGGDSYAIVAEDYMNLSIKFAYHFATIDALCGDKTSQNYVSLQFSGGAGSYYGKTLRVQLIAEVLQRLGFKVDTKGDLVEAVYARFDKESTTSALDNLGRLLASCRLLDITISNQQDVDFYCEQFFKGNYDFINVKNPEVLPSFYLKGGNWKVLTEGVNRYCMYDGSHRTGGALKGITEIISRFISNRSTALIETIESRHQFPLAIVKGNPIKDSHILLKIKLLGGKLDKTAGIAFGIKDIENYLAFGVEATEGAVTLYRSHKGRIAIVERKNKKIDSGMWHHLMIEVNNGHIQGYFNNNLMIDLKMDQPVEGYWGLWAKGDSVTLFEGPTIKTSEGISVVEI